MDRNILRHTQEKKKNQTTNNQYNIWEETNKDYGEMNTTEVNNNYKIYGVYNKAKNIE